MNKLRRLHDYIMIAEHWLKIAAGAVIWLITRIILRRFRKRT